MWCKFISITLLATYLLTQTSLALGAESKPKTGASTTEQSRKVKIKYKDKTDVNFDDALIEGAAKNPFMSMISNRDQEFSKGFIKIRHDWHDQLIMSVSGLSQ